MTDRLHHPRVASSITKEDIASGVKYITYIPGDRVVERGVFKGIPEYDGESDDRWTAPAEVKLGSDVVERTAYLFDAGITPDDTGERWSEKVTIFDDTDEG